MPQRNTRAQAMESTPAAENQNSYWPGSEADFERLYRTSYGRILGTLTGMLGDRAAAEDCCQDAFERAFKKWASWKPIAPAEAWVHRIAINAAVSYRRKMKLREVGEIIRRIGRPSRRRPSSCATTTDIPTEPSPKRSAYPSAPSPRGWRSPSRGFAGCS